MKLGFKEFRKIFYNSAYHTIHDDGIEHAGYLAFLGILSIFPSLIFFFAIAGSIGNQQAGADMINHIYSLMPEGLTATFSQRVNEILSGPPQGLLTIAIIGILWTASGFVEGLRTILNRIYRIKNPPSYFLRRTLSILQFIILIFISTTAMFFLTVAPGLVEMISTAGVKIDINPVLSQIRYYLSAFALLMVVALSYYMLPNLKQKFMSVIPGAFVTVSGWLVAIKILNFYFSNFHQFNVIYGGLAGIIVALIFFYVLAVIYIFGAEFNFFLEQALGHKIEEKEK